MSRQCQIRLGLEVECGELAAGEFGEGGGSDHGKVLPRGPRFRNPRNRSASRLYPLSSRSREPRVGVLVIQRPRDPLDVLFLDIELYDPHTFCPSRNFASFFPASSLSLTSTML